MISLENNLLTINAKIKRKINIHDIIYAEADINYTTLFMLSGKKIIISRSIIRFQELLEDKCFLRVHRKYLVNEKSVNINPETHEVYDKNGKYITKFSRSKILHFNRLKQ
jgi:two-component system LytT family response regulator